MTGTAAAQIIGFALTPIISRLYSPADFGAFGSFSAVYSVIAAGVTLQYTQAIMLPKDKEEAINVLAASILSTLIVSFLCLIACFIASETLNNLMKTDGKWSLIFLVIATVVTGLNQSFQAWSVRVKAFKQTSFSQVIRSLSSNCSKIVFGYLKFGEIGLIISGIFADILASMNLLKVLAIDYSELRQWIRWARIKDAAKEYIDFPLYSASQNMINALSSGLPVLLLGHFYGIKVAGEYAFGVSILQVPMGFILTSLRQVLFQKAAETQHMGGNLLSLYIITTKGLFFTALFPSLVLFVWAPQIFSFIFGEQWGEAGEFTRSLIWWMMLVFCNLPAVLFARIIRLQRTVFIYDLSLLAIRILCLFLGGMFLNSNSTIMLFAIVGALMNGILILIVGYFVFKREVKVV